MGLLIDALESTELLIFVFKRKESEEKGYFYAQRLAKKKHTHGFASSFITASTRKVKCILFCSVFSAPPGAGLMKKKHKNQLSVKVVVCCMETIALLDS